MRTLLASLLLSLPLVSAAHPAAAQSTNCRPDYLGGYRCSDMYGNTTRVRPGLGGFNIQSPSPSSYPSHSPMPCRLMPTQYGVNGYSCQ